MKMGTDDFPERLLDGEGPGAELLRRFTRQPPHAPGENASWDGTLARLGRDAGRHRVRLIFALVVGAVTGAAALYVALAPRTHFSAASEASEVPSPLAPSAASPAAWPAAPPAGPATGAPASRFADTPHIQLGRAAVGLPVGAAELVGEAEVTLSREGSARAFATPTAATVELAAGALDLHVEKRQADAGHAFEVAAGPYRFTVLGTVFRVSRAGDDVTLSVTEGRVAVSQGATTLAVITAGGFWSGVARTAEASPRQAPTDRRTERGLATSPAPRQLVALRTPARETAPAKPFASSSAPAPGADACATRAASGDAAGAADCYSAAAAGADLGAEVALYEAARLYRDALGQPARAVAALQEARRRFPAGVLSTEVSLSLAELLPKLGRYQEALDEAKAILRRRPAEARAAELHLLRGDVLRAGLGRCAAAEAEYLAAARAGDDRVADAASFGRADCLETTGRRAEARAAFALYLTRPHPAHAAEARRHLQPLEAALP